MLRIYDATFPELIQSILVTQALNQALQLIHCLNWIAIKRYTVFNFQNFKLCIVFKE